MKCTYCGAETPAGKNFCMWCGTRQTAAPVKMPESEIVQVPVDVPEQTVAEPVAPKQVVTVQVVTEQAALEQEFPVIQPAKPTPVPESKPVPAPAPVKTQDRPRRIPPRLQLPTERSLCKMFFLGLVTLGIYPIAIWSRIVTEVNIVASRYDGKRTMSYFGMTMLTPITLGIYPLIWMHQFCHRIRDELVRRNSDYNFSPSDFWLWGVLGSLFIVGPFIFTHKLMKAMNKINAHYNVYG